MKKRIKYYIKSLIILIREVKNFYFIFLWWVLKKPAKINLKNGISLYIINLIDFLVIKETFFDDCYESKVIKNNHPNVIDIGAAMGDFSIFIAKKYPKAMVYPYEPYNKSFELLKRNIKINNLDNIFPTKKAVTSKSGYVSFLINSKAVQNTTTNFGNNDSQKIKVKSTNLQHILDENKISCCDLLKIDCEGGEFDILLGCSKKTLSKIKSIVLEYHDGFSDYSHHDLANFLINNNFQVEIKPNIIHNYLGILKATRK